MSRIPSKVTEVKKNRPSICFHHLTDTVSSLEELDRELLVQMLKKFKVLGGIEWNDISKSGLGWEKIPHHSMKYPIPKSLKMDHLYHIYITKKFRVWGYRDGDTFQLVWVDPNHNVTK
ncbi:MAG6450 family protein [Paenibacillus sp. FSL R7-0179]|uniref:MAG6450 family protein n=1 Tax=Paenibacillus sp. FSL R7-0179 TaxID=2921672 RepID=UPI0030FA56BB